MGEKRLREPPSNVIISQSTNQIRSSEIPRSRTYSVSTSPDPPLHVFFLLNFFTQAEGLGMRLAHSMLTFPCRTFSDYGVCRETTVVQNSCTTSCCGLSGFRNTQAVIGQRLLIQ